VAQRLRATTPHRSLDQIDSSGVGADTPAGTRSLRVL